ncbi:MULTISPECIES: hypothetical protein [Leclercia]|uniref:hypothetical protein n=1 Tax=Leclercia TaxID=83654 RepID=UPI000ED33041|nr:MULTISPECIES: hypothetical protein [Leclercia]QGU16028.1 hypothetical protein GNG27_15660 [Leclercia sp. 119287]UGB00917.1 hypothetical protein LRS40_14480 [Leclercia sp. G3L]HCN95807.1 hypothetical protein [Leclercia sp.]
MPEYIFFQKGTKIIALDKSDVQGASLLCEQGYKKQFEEIIAPDSQRALARLADIKKEEEIAPLAWATGAVFTVLIVPVLGLIGYLFLK